ncbi:MAG TPA: ABC transporter ATP-binding protein [Steroidobacteraceae bacterium]|nr:ABC transporter ATP-binding protein [Steroidobacteraceae bacterium]
MIIQTQGLCKTYGRNDALRGLNLAVAEGSALALIGANGAGKTTTIKVLMNMLAPSAGTATVLGVDTRRLSRTEFAHIGYVSENQRIPRRLTVSQYLGYLRPLYANWDRALERSILAQLRLPPNRKIGELSHGMRMKMALACALPFRPRLLVLDEPFSGLDPLVRDEFLERVLEQAGAMTVLISTHELADIDGVATDVAFIDDGRLLFQEPMSALSARLRRVEVLLDQEAREPPGTPASWLDVRAVGNVLSFVESRFAEEELGPRIAAVLPRALKVDVERMPLRSIFTTLARSAQRKAG